MRVATTLESSKLSEADRDVKVLRDQIEEEIRDEEIDPDPRMSFQEPERKFRKGC